MEDILNGWRKRFELIELIIPVGTTGDTFAIPDIPQLRDDKTQDIIIVGIETYAADTVPLSPAGNAVATMAELENMFLTLYIEQEESIFRLPLPRIQPIWEANTAGALQGGQQTLSLECLKVTWNKSYLTFGEAITPEDLPISVLLGVWYKKLMPNNWAAMRAAAGYTDPGW
jgi:hypothetical protein